MKCKHLLIITLEGVDDPEVMGGKDALITKYQARIPPLLSIAHAVVGPEITIHTEITSATFTSDNPRDYGVYILFHFSTMADTIDRFGNAYTFEEFGHLMAEMVYVAAFDAVGFKQLGKVCMLACNAAELEEINGEKSLAGFFCDKMAELCKGRRQPPLVAGWESFITVAFPDAEELKTKFKNPKDTGRKVGENPGKSNKTWGNTKGAHKHKIVFRYSPENKSYGRFSVEQAGWSDKDI